MGWSLVAWDVLSKYLHWVHDQFILELRSIQFHIVSHYLGPTFLVVIVEVLVVVLWRNLYTLFYLRIKSYLFRRVSFPEPCLILLMELPVFLLQLYRCEVLLVSPLLVVKGEEKSILVKFLEVLSPVIHW